MAAIKCRRTTVSVLIPKILGPRAAAAGDKHFRLIVDEFGIGVCPAKQESVLERTLNEKLTRVVDGVAAVRARGHRAKIGVLAKRIELLIDEEVLASRSDIRGGSDQAAWERALNVEIPLMSQRI